MFYFKRNFHIKINSALILFVLFFISSCMPSSTAPSLNESSSSEDTKSSVTSSYPEPNYPLNGIFIQEGENQSLTHFALASNFSDTFLIRGKSLSLYLKNLTESTKLCLVTKFKPLTTSPDTYLILSATPRSYVDFINKTREYYLQVSPANKDFNENHCDVSAIKTTLSSHSSPPAPNYSFALSTICPTCLTPITGSGLRLYFTNGKEVPSISLNLLIPTIGGATSSTINSCSESTSCQAKGFSCCLNGQCVKDGATKPGAFLLSGYDQAKLDVESHPARISLYPQYFFVCGSRPESAVTTTPSTSDPDYEASVRLMELKNLYDCINKVDGEFSHCSLKFENVTSTSSYSGKTQGFNDDINFSSLNPNLELKNIVKVFYGGKNLTATEDFILGLTNDDLTNSQTVTLKSSALSNRKDNNLYLTYKIDGTCEAVTSTRVRCTKTYIQQSSDIKLTTYHDSSKTFRLPNYANLDPSTEKLVVKVGGVVVPESSTTWGRSTDGIEFKPAYKLYQNQTIEITYFVKESDPLSVMKLKKAAQEKINSMCHCHSDYPCGLSPIFDSKKEAVVNYECSILPPTSTTPPVNQTVYVTSKNVPHRYYDENGVSYDNLTTSTPPQELPEFIYSEDNLLLPNNVTKYIGFNEIYGSLKEKSKNPARPAKVVSVKNGMFYDIVARDGAFSGCQSCGSDYYGSYQKIFPQNFKSYGGGYSPNLYESSRHKNKGIYRADDLLFGRACFIPATMIPWTHAQGSTVKDQRQARLNAQHFLFANGYNRDWYGFDYGSLIGSFDGVKWFSIGTQRRVRASGTKLYLAINSYFGDLNSDNKFSVNISESTDYSSDIADHDSETDGAECQSAHFCKTDDDCYRLLGFDYTCQNVTSIRTNWPNFSVDGTELIGSTSRTLSSLIGGTNGQTNRCIYRGRGAPCLPDLNKFSSSPKFNGSPLIGTVMCSPNNSCTPLTSSRFNDRIARFGASPEDQNNSHVTTLSDLLGFGARVIGRPFDYYGTKTIRSSVSSTLESDNKVIGLCTPGKDFTGIIPKSKTWDLHAKTPGITTDSSDKLYGTGRTTSTSTKEIFSLNACPATDSTGKSIHLSNTDLDNANLNLQTISQNLSSNLLDLTPLKDVGIFSSTNGSEVLTLGYQRNTCLRAAGASCFSDLECAPSDVISEMVSASDLTGYLSEAEINFWKEDLICGNPEFKYNFPGVVNSAYDIKNNKCCRDVGKTLSVYTQTSRSEFKWCDDATSINVAGVNLDYKDKSRYSRVHSVYDQMTCKSTDISSTKKFALSLKSSNSESRFNQVKAQYETLDKLNERTCCTKHWVRSFSEDNGGGHAFTPSKMQIIDKAMFKHVSWEPDLLIKDPLKPLDPPKDPDPGAFECDEGYYDTTSCEVKNFTENEEKKYLSWAASLELIGIPQAMIKTNYQIYKLVDDNQSSTAPLQALIDSNDNKIINALPLLPLLEIEIYPLIDFFDKKNGSNGVYYSGTNYKDGLNLGTNTLKKVFSEHEFNCCIPSGKAVPSTTTASQCCTGFSNTISNTTKVCCLPDYTDLTVYLNRYVSSEGRGLDKSEYDETTGYIKNPNTVERLAIQNNMCCSGTVARGVAISELPIPLINGAFDLSVPEDPDVPPKRTRRFNYLTGEIDNNPETGYVGYKFDAGVRWNHHVYCVPEGYE